MSIFLAQVSTKCGVMKYPVSRPATCQAVTAVGKRPALLRRVKSLSVESFPCGGGRPFDICRESELWGHGPRMKMVGPHMNGDSKSLTSTNVHSRNLFDSVVPSVIASGTVCVASRGRLS
jgi:hypothetical protein